MTTVAPAEPHGSPDRFPAARVDLRVARRAALGALTALGLLLGGVEVGLRAAGWRPSVNDSPELHGWYRQQATAAGPNAVVLLGGSRMQLGFDAETFRRRHPHRPTANLALDGGSGTGFLEDLAADPNFRGTVIVDFNALHLGEAMLAESRLRADEARATTASERRHARLWAAVEAKSVVAGDMRFRWEAIAALLKGEAPPPPITYRAADRFVAADYRGAGATSGALQRHQLGRLERHLAEGRLEQIEPAEWLRRSAPLRDSVERIVRRGGRVAFVRFPTTGAHWDIDERRYPRPRYWDRLEARVGAPTVHFRDLPAAAALECPDGSHLDERDRPVFTAALLDELGRRGVL
ncbi:hypothetical protein [Alienimonas californiensis]|uniref:Uncharacterized protein n=1 Tax=Alienimonas californiensis TaxID=2527989 RepID=A0A517PE67_9PLAN|nr:hypothetical protein [Alienimonas californiensis]QDT17659.1 hypothetical protein CA12_37890 [Alienimonas californiensis]